jgi:hypothetical protein
VRRRTSCICYVGPKTYVKPLTGVDRVLVFGQLSLTPKDDEDPYRDWYGAWWCSSTNAFHADGEGFIVSVTHWMPLPETPDGDGQSVRDK